MRTTALVCLALAVSVTVGQDCPPVTTLDVLVTPTASQLTVAWNRPITFNASSTAQVRVVDQSNWVGKNAPSHVFPNLEASTEYTVESRLCLTPACCGAVTTTKISTQNGTAVNFKIPEIKTFASANATDTTVDTSWEASKLCSSYEVVYCKRSDACATPSTVKATSNSLTVTGLSDFTSYNFYVRCVIGTQKGKRTPSVLATTKASSNVKPTTSSNMTSITVTIPAKTSLEATNGTYWVKVGEVEQPAIANKAIFGGLNSSTTYQVQFKWCATYDQDCGDYLVIEQRTGADKGEAATLDKSLPDVTDLTLDKAGTGANNLAITWKAANNQSLFEVKAELCNKAGVCTVSKKLTVNDTNDPKNFSIVGLVDLNEYKVTVTSLKTVGATQLFGNPLTINATTLASPLQGATATKAAAATFIAISWTAKTSNSQVVYVVKKVYPTPDGPELKIRGMNSIQYTNDVVNNEIYSFELKVCDETVTICSEPVNAVVIT